MISDLFNNIDDTGKQLKVWSKLMLGATLLSALFAVLSYFKKAK